MRILVALTMIATSATASAAPPARPVGPALSCPNQLHQAQRKGSGSARKLIEEPAGNLYLTVMRDKGSGCYEPVLVREGIGAVRDPKQRRR